MGLFIYTPEDLCEQSLQTIANSLKCNITLQHLSIGGQPFSEQQFNMICQRIEVVKWEVKEIISTNKLVTLFIDF